ncbi:MAG: 3-methyl-2-oxobutanoate dehydrogenase subunit beta [Sulfolobales archaeon]
MSVRIRIDQIPKEKYSLPGNAACQGCPHLIGLKILGKVFRGELTLVVPAGCTSIIPGYHPYSSLDMRVIHVPFASAAAVAGGISRAFKIRGEELGPVVVWAGDGATFDIGFATLSGSAVRDDNIIYIVSDNEAYMNTGIQASGSTTYGARTTTTPVLGKRDKKKEIDLIMLMHKIPYVATASVAFPLDLYEKLVRASKIKGFRFIHLHSPCPPGWRFDDDKTVEVARLAVETGAWILFEFAEGRLTISPNSRPYIDKSRRRPLKQYLELQGRFRGVTEEDIKIIEEMIDENWRIIEFLSRIYST